MADRVYRFCNIPQLEKHHLELEKFYVAKNTRRVFDCRAGDSPPRDGDGQPQREENCGESCRTSKSSD
jgi:hypothetical protein